MHKFHANMQRDAALGRSKAVPQQTDMTFIQPTTIITSGLGGGQETSTIVHRGERSLDKWLSKRESAG